MLPTAKVKPTPRPSKRPVPSLDQLWAQGTELPTPGSAGHNEGTCSPCAWYWKEDSCTRGDDCQYCHLCGPGEIKSRRKAKKDQLRLISIGSAGHADGTRQPCYFFHKADGGMSGRPVNKRKFDTSDGEHQACRLAGDAQPTSSRQSSPPSIRPSRTVKPTRKPCKIEQKSYATDDYFDGDDTDKLDNEPGDDLDLPSVGSAGHAHGSCKPCAWIHKPSGCTNGYNCRHCHLCPPDEVKRRKREKMQANNSRP